MFEVKINDLLQVLFPKRCAICDGLLKKDERYVCRGCVKKIRFIKDRTCVNCGRVLRSKYEVLCAECTQNKFCFDGAFAPFTYTGEIKESLLRFKYYNRPEYAGFFAACMFRYGKDIIKSWKPVVMIPVPVHKNRLKKRGYNQAALLAMELGKLTGIRVREDIVLRTKKTVAQKELGSRERRKNMVDAFTCVCKENMPETIMIVDDIFTTGSTVDAISELLKAAGAKKIYIITVAN